MATFTAKPVEKSFAREVGGDHRRFAKGRLAAGNLSKFERRKISRREFI